MKRILNNIKQLTRSKVRSVAKWWNEKTAPFVVLAEVDSKRIAVHYARDLHDARDWAAQYQADDMIVCYHSLCGVPLSVAFKRGI